MLTKCFYLGNDTQQVKDTFLLTTVVPGGMNKFTTEPFLFSSDQRRRIRQAMEWSGQNWPRGHIQVRLSGRNENVQTHQGCEGLDLALICGVLGKHPKNELAAPLKVKLQGGGVVKIQAYLLGRWHDVGYLEEFLEKHCD
jgi:hypothetical protein